MEITNLEQCFGQTMLGVEIDRSLELDRLIEKARKLSFNSSDHLVEGIRELVIEALPQNAVVISEDEVYSVDQRASAKALVWEPLEKTLSFALRRQMACCRYYHTLFFLLALAAKLGRVLWLCGKMIPGRDFGYTWVEVHFEDQTSLVVDLFAESLRRARRPDLDYDDPSGKYQNPIPVHTFVARVEGAR